MKASIIPAGVTLYLWTVKLGSREIGSGEAESYAAAQNAIDVTIRGAWSRALSR